jgi:hypothetical protein
MVIGAFLLNYLIQKYVFPQNRTAWQIVARQKRAPCGN